MLFDNNDKSIVAYGYNITVLSEVPDDAVCLICKNVMSKPSYGLCNCHYCYSCIKQWIKDGNNFCPGRTNICYETILNHKKNIFHDDTKAELINRMQVECPNPICDFQGTFKMIELHLHQCEGGVNFDDCLFEGIGCPEKHMTMINMIKHLNMSSLHHSQLLCNAITKMENDIIRLEDLVLKEREERNKLLKDRVTTEKYLKEQIKFLEDKINNSQVDESRIYENLWDNNRQATAATKETLGELDNINGSTLSKQPTSLQSHSEADLFSRTLNRQYDIIQKQRELKAQKMLVPFVWTIEDVLEKKKEASSLFSDTFYRNGYNMRLRANLNGLDCGKDTHLSVYFVILKGAYDECLEWPMKCKIRISLLCHDTKTYRDYRVREYFYDKTPKEWQHCFNKPISDKNSSYGHHQLILFKDLLRSPEVYKNNSIRLCCKVFR